MFLCKLTQHIYFYENLILLAWLKYENKKWLTFLKYMTYNTVLKFNVEGRIMFLTNKFNTFIDRSVSPMFLHIAIIK